MRWVLSVWFPVLEKHRQQVRFIRETLAANSEFDDRRVIASLSTVPDRVDNLSRRSDPF